MTLSGKIADPVMVNGTLHFKRDGIHILSPEWALADYEDGHYVGKALFKYVRYSNGRISWKLIEASPDFSKSNR